jgi:transcriptional accessory protein Tex/SPT6
VKELKRQRAEIYKLQLVDEKTLKDTTKRLTTLTKISERKPEELEEITQLNAIIKELNKNIAEFVKNQPDLETIYLPIEGF